MGILSLNLFWCKKENTLSCDADTTPVGVRDIYALEFQIFKNPLWAVFYIFAVVVFVTHACLGWKKVTPVLGIPKLHIKNVERLGYLIFLVIGAIYVSFPVYVWLAKADNGGEVGIQHTVFGQ
eukprot:TRINITY_DN10544_c0_g1_i1.p3 TRINITY_DN10544_c0_g1~~TRINITY_DN10544_c0_g1_i1.p3  ORF type:complete len:123 (-),score=30.17 TRINITY_DN10544_c0_g1_i1:52-420(-)